MLKMLVLLQGNAITYDINILLIAKVLNERTSFCNVAMTDRFLL